MATLLTITMAVQVAKQDAWISTLLGSAVAMLLTFFYVKLAMRYPGKTIIQFSQDILGTWLGKIIVIPYFVTWYSVFGTILRQAVDFIYLSLFTATPVWIITVVILVVVAYMTYVGGIESIARCAEVIGPIILVMLIFIFVLNFHDLHAKRLLPIYADTGWWLITKGAIPSMTFLTESSILLVLLAFSAKQDKVLSSSLWAMVVSSAALLETVMMVIMTFGTLAEKMWYPLEQLVRYIYVMEFIQNVDSIFVILLLLSGFVKLAMYLFVASYSTAQWLGFQSWRTVVWGVLGIGYIIAVLFKNIDVATVEYPSQFWIPYVFPICFIAIPFILLLVDVIRRGTRIKT